MNRSLMRTAPHASMRTPRAQSGAGMARLPTGRTSPSSSALPAGAHQHPPLLDVQLPRLQLGQRRRRPRATGRGRGARRGTWSTRRARGSPSGRGGRWATAGPTSPRGRRPRSPSAPATHRRTAGAAVSGWRPRCPSRVASSSSAPEVASRSSSAPAVSSARHGLRHHAEHRAGVQALLEPEGGGTGDGVAVPHRGLHRRGPAPGRKQREMEVDPAVAGHVQRRPRHQRAVGHHGAAVGRQLAQGLEEHADPGGGPG